MKEIKGNLWDYHGKLRHVILITTNGFVRKDGLAVMGRGCAFEAAKKMPTLPKLLGDSLKKHGNIVTSLHPEKKKPMRRRNFQRHIIITFPVKNNWYDDASVELIQASTKRLKEIAEFSPEVTFVLPRPGCGNGRLDWDIVKPLLKDLPDNVLVISR